MFTIETLENTGIKASLTPYHAGITTPDNLVNSSTFSIHMLPKMIYYFFK